MDDRYGQMDREMDRLTNDKRVEQGFICPLIHSFIYHLLRYIHTCMFHPLQDAIWMNRQMDGC